MSHLQDWFLLRERFSILIDMQSNENIHFLEPFNFFYCED